MITLKHSIEINTTPEKIFNWMKNLNKHFVKWHPNHTKFEFGREGLKVGGSVYFEERIEGKDFDFDFKITKVGKTKKGWIAEFERPGAKIIFKAESKGKKCIFSHIEKFGKIKSNNFFTKKILVPIFRKLTNPIYRYDLIKKDLIEDNINLKKIMEKNIIRKVKFK